MHVQGVGGVDSGHPGQAAAGMGLFEGTQVSEVEDRAKVDVEALGPLAGKDRKPDDAPVVGQCGAHQVGGVVRGREGPDVAGGYQQVRPEHLGFGLPHRGYRTSVNVKVWGRDHAGDGRVVIGPVL